MRFASGLLAILLPTGAYAAEGMPQLDFANPLTIAQVVWLVIIFALLYALLSRWALPQVAVVLEQRAARIGADLEQARAAAAGADTAEAEVLEATRKAQAAAQAEINSAVGRAKADAAARAADANTKLDAQLAEAEQRIAAARGAAMGAVRGVAVDTATAVIARLTRAQPAAGAVEHAVDAVLAPRPA